MPVLFLVIVCNINELGCKGTCLGQLIYIHCYLLRTTFRTKTEPHEHKRKLTTEFIGRTHEAFIQSRTIVTNKQNENIYKKRKTYINNITILIDIHADESHLSHIPALHIQIHYFLLRESQRCHTDAVIAQANNLGRLNDFPSHLIIVPSDNPGFTELRLASAISTMQA